MMRKHKVVVMAMATVAVELASASDAVMAATAATAAIVWAGIEDSVLAFIVRLIAGQFGTTRATWTIILVELCGIVTTWITSRAISTCIAPVTTITKSKRRFP